MTFFPPDPLSGGQGGDNDNDVDPRGGDYNDAISLAMATAMRVAGDKECDGGKSDGDDEKGCRRATATAPKRAVAVATRAAGDKEGNGEGGESDGDAYEESDGGGKRAAGDEEGDGEGGESDGDTYEEGDGGGDEGGGRRRGRC